jgi:phosphatidylglycerol:prolipoprotein diacylglycerol transferase
LNYKVYPTQLFEAAVLGLIFLLLITRQKRPHFRGEIFLAYLFLYAGARYFLEYLRGDVLPVFLGLTFAQLVSLIFIAAVPIFWLILRKGPK